MNIAKNQKILFDLEKQRGAQNTIKKIIVDDEEITEQTHILECIKEFFETLFNKRKQKTATEIKKFFKARQYFKTLKTL